MPLLLEAEAPLEETSAIRKRDGVHYTPPELARFLARRTLRHAEGELVVLDPACGDGELLSAVAIEAHAARLPPPHLVGIDSDPEAVAIASKRLTRSRAASCSIEHGDFLALERGGGDGIRDECHVAICNPPYVRTQVLGATRARELGRQFGLSGRVDLYHAFVAAMTAKLSEGGILGLLCSNRFLTTKSGLSLRSLLLGRYQIRELWDLGDTKLFDAAVLPAVVIARRTRRSLAQTAAFTRVYEDKASKPGEWRADSLLGALECDREGSLEVAGRRFKVERGELARSSAGRPWRLSSAGDARWLASVKRRTAGRLADLGPIRVGIKTTADSVFIRSDWLELPVRHRPEPELVRPLLTHRVAARWRALEEPERLRSVLYTYETRGGCRKLLGLSRFPRAAAYLEQHRERLESRKYLIEAGRQWYEIWVPQQPEVWALPKLVWPDISDRPRFFLDSSGAIVNGDCYWLSCGAHSQADIALALAVANSSFALRYYDHASGNRLYANRRRFITQYLEDLPLPEASAAAKEEIVAMVEQLQQRNLDRDRATALEASLDAAVSSLFGVQQSLR